MQAAKAEVEAALASRRAAAAPAAVTAVAAAVAAAAAASSNASFLVLLAVWPEWRGAAPQPLQHTLQHPETALVDVVIVPAT